MLNHIKTISRIFLLFFVIISTRCYASEQIDIYVISNVTEGKFLGDRNQALSVEKELAKLMTASGKSVQTFEFDKNKIPALEKQIAERNIYSVIISSGDHGIISIKKISKNQSLKKKILTVWSGHQLFKHLKENLKYINVVALPEYVVNKDFKKACISSGVSLVQTPTVPTSIESDITYKDYGDFPLKNQIPLNKKYLVIFLGGDAPDTTGYIHQITKREIERLALHASEIAHTHKLRVVLANSPRTSTWQSEELLSQLNTHGMNKVLFFDFHEGVQAYNPLLYLIKHTKHDTQVIVTGDSTSMVDEILEIYRKPIYVLKASNMTDAHNAHLNYRLKLHNIIPIYATEPFQKGSVTHITHAPATFRESTSLLVAECIKSIINKTEKQ